jgi:hypothetical protein
MLFWYTWDVEGDNRAEFGLGTYLTLVEPAVTASYASERSHTEPVFLNIYGAQKSNLRNEFRQPM